LRVTTNVSPWSSARIGLSVAAIAPPAATQQIDRVEDRIDDVAGSQPELLGRIESLYRERFADFVAVAASVVGEREAAREAVQDAFASVVRNRRDFRGDGPLEAWVWRVVVNAARKKKRRGRDLVPAEAAAFSENGATPDDEREHGLASVIARLPERQRLVLFLRYYADLDYRTIAETLGVRIGTVSATLHAAHNTLYDALNEVER
jgi:RNA polymerase sigma-70 factor (ECF subfamily)